MLCDAYRDALAVVRPDFFDQPIVKLVRPFALHKPPAPAKREALLAQRGNYLPLFIAIFLSPATFSA